MTKETLEEAAKKYAEGKSSASVFQEAHKKDFIAGAECQAKRMYNEEELRKAIQLARQCTLDKHVGDFVDLSGLTEVCTYGLEETHSEDSIIEQFKKN